MSWLVLPEHPFAYRCWFLAYVTHHPATASTAHTCVLFYIFFQVAEHLTQRFLMKAGQLFVGWVILVFYFFMIMMQKKKKEREKWGKVGLFHFSAWGYHDMWTGQNNLCRNSIQIMRLQLMASFLFAFAKVSVVQSPFWFPASAEGYPCYFAGKFYLGMVFFTIFRHYSGYQHGDCFIIQTCTVVSAKPPLQKP